MVFKKKSSGAGGIRSPCKWNGHELSCQVGVGIGLPLSSAKGMHAMLCYATQHWSEGEVTTPGPSCLVEGSAYQYHQFPGR